MREFIKNKLRESIIDTQTMCNTMSVATYEEGIKLLIKSIGKPNENPELWFKIKKPLKFWRDENVLINNEIKQKHMSGDSMVDESNTWWSAIQTTLCPNQ